MENEEDKREPGQVSAGFNVAPGDGALRGTDPLSADRPDDDEVGRPTHPRSHHLSQPLLSLSTVHTVLPLQTGDIAPP